MIRLLSRSAAIILLGMVFGCHFRAGLGPEPEGPPSKTVENHRDSSVAADGTKTVQETTTDTTEYPSGKSMTVRTVKHTTTDPDGKTSTRTTVTTTENDGNGGTMSSTSSQTH